MTTEQGCGSVGFRDQKDSSEPAQTPENLVVLRFHRS
jgi:hypothetical protein